MLCSELSGIYDCEEKALLRAGKGSVQGRKKLYSRPAFLPSDGSAIEVSGESNLLSEKPGRLVIFSVAVTLS